MVKRIFDLFFSLLGLISFSWLIIILIILSRIDTSGSGVFRQDRIGQFGRIFKIFKIRTIHIKTHQISKFGKFIRKFKLDELPQFLNILKGDMTFVGPRPDIPGYYDNLENEERKILCLKPGLFSWATIKYIDEEKLLATKKNPLEYNDKVIFPEKVKMNLEYYYNQSLKEDIRILFYSIKSVLSKIFS